MRWSGNNVMLGAGAVFLAVLASGSLVGQDPDDDRLLDFGRAGKLRVGTSVDRMAIMFGKENLRLVDRWPEGMFSPAIEIRLDRSVSPAFVVQIREWPCAEHSAWGITVFDRRFRTREGLGVGSTLAEVRRHVRSDVDEIGGVTFVNDAKRGLSFVFDAHEPIATTRVKEVFVVSQPVHVRKTVCPHLGPIDK
jgi:hypothetical protein